jgi:3-hydroxybutyryl-CoA dehydrogenase
MGFANVAVIGAGLMGHGLALVHALGGCTVRLYDTSEKTLETAGTRIADAARTLAAGGAIAASDAEAAPERIAPCGTLAQALADCDLIVEAIVENPEAKRELFADAAGHAPAHAVLASNTSFLDIFPLLPAALEERAFIVHWYTPPYIVDLVDVVAAPGTPDGLRGQMTDFLRSLGKKPVVLKQFMPGYLANRIQFAIENEAFRLVDEGIADVESVDDSIRHGLALRLALLGQFKKLDYTGLRVVRDVHREGFYEPPGHPTGGLLDRLVEAGHEGVTSGRGFYDYRGREAADLFRDRDRALLALKAAVAGIES